MISPSEYIPTCPRCGYDQSGEVARWRESCPLEGVCPECGLRFEWVEILEFERRHPRWHFEHATGWSRATATLRFFAWSMMPWTLWRRVRLSHEVVSQRLAAFVVLAALMFLLSGSLLAFAHTVAFGSPDYYTTRSSRGHDVWSVIVASISPSLSGLPLLFALCFGVFMPASFLLLSTTMKGIGVESKHLVRGAVYALGPIGLAISAASVLERFRVYEWMPRPDWVVACWIGLTIPITAWWWWFISRYLQLPHAAGVFVLHAVMSWLGTTIVFIGVYVVSLNVL